MKHFVFWLFRFQLTQQITTLFRRQQIRGYEPIPDSGSRFQIFIATYLIIIPTHEKDLYTVVGSCRFYTTAFAGGGEDGHRGRGVRHSAGHAGGWEH